MWRAIILLLAPLWVFANPITVVGVGNNIEQAKLNGFRTAIELYVGTVIVSERDYHNYRNIKNELLVYSSGYVDRYQIISTQDIDDQIRLVMDVTVSTNKISNRILGKFSSNEFIDGDRFKAQVDSFTEERNNADKLLANVLKDYPYRAFTIEQKNYRIESIDRNLFLVMPYKLSWNYNYLVALSNVLEKTQDAKPRFNQRATSRIYISATDPTRYFVGQQNNYHFNDTTHPQLISDTFYDNEIRLMGKLYNRKNEVVWHICHNPIFLSGHKPSFYAIGDVLNIKLFGTIIEEDNVKLLINTDLNRLLPDIYTVKLEIVKRKDC